MPIYEYKCKACGHQFEKLIRSADQAAAVVCEKCSGAVKKLVSAFACSGSDGFRSSSTSSSSCGSCSSSNCSSCK